jgi:hypothetical protein
VALKKDPHTTETEIFYQSYFWDTTLGVRVEHENDQSEIGED